MGKVQWTEAGITRLRENAIADLKSRIAGLKPQKGVHHMTDESRVAALSIELGRRLSTNVARLAELEPAPAPLQRKVIAIGHEVRITYLSDCARKKRGTTNSSFSGVPGRRTAIRFCEPTARPRCSVRPFSASP